MIENKENPSPITPAIDAMTAIMAHASDPFVKKSELEEKLGQMEAGEVNYETVANKMDSLTNPFIRKDEYQKTIGDIEESISQIETSEVNPEAVAEKMDKLKDPFLRNSAVEPVFDDLNERISNIKPPEVDYDKIQENIQNMEDPFVTNGQMHQAISAAVGVEHSGGSDIKVQGSMARYYNLWVDYGVNHDHRNVKVKDMLKPGEEATKLQWAWKAATGGYLRLTADEFREMNWFSATFLDASFRGEAAGFLNQGKQNVYNFVEIPTGHYISNVNLPIPRGGMRGQGNYRYWGNGVDHGQVTTSIEMTNSWIDKHPEILLFSGPNMLSEGDDAYSEGNEVSNINLEGPGIIQDGRRRIGIVLGRAGEGSSWDRICSNRFDIGIAARGATPMAGGVCSVFDNRIAGFAGIGTAQATMRVDLISGDRNGSLVRLMPGYNTRSGGKLDIGLLKAEDANRQGGGRYGSQVVGWFEGQFVVNINMVSDHCQDRYNDAVFVVDPVLHDIGHGQASYLTAKGLGENYNTLIHNLQAKTRRKHPGAHKAWSFEWYAEGDAVHSNTPGFSRSALAAGSKALGSLPRSGNNPVGNWNYAAGTPARTDQL